MMGNKAEGKGGGIANIQKSMGRSVYGIIYRLDTKELDDLNKLEISMDYDVTELDIYVSEYINVKASVYIGAQTNEVQYKPTTKYSEFIINGMKNHKFHEKYQVEVIGMMDI